MTVGDEAAQIKPQQACGDPAPDRSPRSCDLPKGHEGDHWTYAGRTLKWPQAPEDDTTERRGAQRMTVTECCGVAVEADQRYCPRCGWEYRAQEEKHDDVFTRLDNRFAEYGDGIV